MESKQNIEKSLIANGADADQAWARFAEHRVMCFQGATDTRIGDKLAKIGHATASGHRCGDAFDIYVDFKLNGDFTKALQSLAPPATVLDYSALASASSPDTLGEGKPKDISISDIQDNPSLPVEFLIEGILPVKVVTLLAGHGGTSKSMLSLQAGASLAMGLPFLGMKSQRVKVLVYSAEDDSHIVRNRLATICDRMKIDPKELAKNLTVQDASEGDPVLFIEKKESAIVTGVPTPAMQDLIHAVARTGARVIILDNSSDVYGADEIKRVQVRAFIRMLAQMARKANAAVLLLAHVDKQAAKSISNEGYSGSTAWNNSVRSRLFIKEDKEGRLTIEHQKSNYSKRIESISLVFDRGLVVLEEEKFENVSDISAFNAVREIRENTVLQMLHEFYQRGEWISSAQSSPNNAYKMLLNEQSYPKGMSKSDLWQLLREAERGRKIYKETYRNHSRHDAQRWCVNSAATVRQLDSQSGPE